ncbi:MAG: apolipoprotein N-acyltransferase [Acidobacteriota bacterium]|nr:apolipoprotein N-acyltransferase [Acidobacteriota bacterium]
MLTFPRANIAWLAPVALAPLLFAAFRERRPLRRFLLGYGAGVVYWFGVCYWIQFVLSVHGGMGEAVGWAVFLLFCFAKALQMGVFALLAGIAMRRAWAAPAIAALWVAIEATHGPMGFAWLALGNAGADMSLPMRLAPYTGVYGVSFIFALMAALLVLAILRRPRPQLAWVLLLPLLVLLPKLPEPERGSATAVLVQPDIADDEQWTPQSFARMEQRLTLLSTGTILKDNKPVDVLVWPEVPAPLYDNDPDLKLIIARLAAATEASFLLGVVGHAPDGAIFNSALLIAPSGETVSRYDKVNLVPFGEFVPWPLGALTRKISTEAGDFRPGTRVVVSSIGERRIGTFICYESVFPNFIRQFAANGAEVLFNISNDSWFGKSAARDQHLRIVRMRAVENRRWILRATNDGITASIDPAGRLRSVAPSYAAIASRVNYGYVSETTVYTRHGDWFVWLCVLIGLCAVVKPGIQHRATMAGVC